MFYDSTFRLTSGGTFTPTRPGVYLIQRDTNAAEGFAFLGVTDIYPKFSSIADLAEPLLYVTTSDEFAQIDLAGNDKSKFDKVILDVTGDRERAKTLCAAISEELNYPIIILPRTSKVGKPIGV